jgi:hypothetical protein
MDQQHCDVCAEKLKSHTASRTLDGQTVRPLIDAYGINKIYLRELCAEAQVFYPRYPLTIQHLDLLQLLF